MEDLPGNYIAIDRLTFDQTRFDIKVKAETTHRCHPDDVCIVVPTDYATPHYWEVKTTHDAD